MVPHVSGNNWFEGNAGNQTLSGSGNFGTGDQSLQSLTTGYDNVAVGSKAMRLSTTANTNFAFGSGALEYCVADTNNVVIGPIALQVLGYGGAGGGSNTQNVAIGYGAFNQLQQGSSNIAIGFSAGGNIVGPATSPPEYPDWRSGRR